MRFGGVAGKLGDRTRAAGMETINEICEVGGERATQCGEF